METPKQRVTLVLVGALSIGVICGIVSLFVTRDVLGVLLFVGLAVIMWLIICAVYEAVWLRRPAKNSRRLTDSFDP